MNNSNYIIWTYVIYLILSLGFTLWVGQTLHKRGRVFLLDCFNGNAEVADSLNHLFIVGFYLINIGYLCLMLTYRGEIPGLRFCFEVISFKVGGVVMVLGVMHFFNLLLLNLLRRRNLTHKAPPVLVAA